MEAKLTVFYESPFWVAIFERVDERGYSTARHVFGPEPSTGELYALLLDNYERLNFTECRATQIFTPKRTNPKRVQREINRSLKENKGSKKAYDELKKQYKEHKTALKVRKRGEKEERQRQKFILKQQKKKRRKRGH